HNFPHLSARFVRYIDAPRRGGECCVFQERHHIIATPINERRETTMLPPAEFARKLLKEAEDTHPWLHHPLFHMIWDGRLSRDQVRDIIGQQGAFFLDTLRHAAWKIISVGGVNPTWDDLQRQRALIPLVVAEGGEDTVG